MIVYLAFIGLVISSFSLDYLYKKEGCGIFALFAILLTILLVILRYYVGYDYDTYSYFFGESISSLIDKKLEWGFIGIVWFLHLFEADPFWLFFCFGVGIIGFILHGVKLYTRNVRIAFLIYLLIPGLFLNSLSIIRQALAIAILFNAFYYYCNKRYKTFWILFLLAFLFHYSSLLVLPFFLLAPKLQGKAKWLIWIGIPLSLILYKLNFIDTVITALLGSSRFVVYAEYEDAGASFVKLLVLNLSVVVYLFFYKKMDKQNRSMLALAVIGLLLLNTCASVGAITRISYYFKIFEIVLLANIVSYFRASLNRVVACTCIFIYFFAMFYSALYRDYTAVDTYPKMTPYQTIWER
ncbi:EpsG family protein [Alistipes ihumii]|uniref:EpsG family protein n=1 Tax=Alistipes ihumii TaxID=1470347 RepID=UPI003993D253